MRRTGGWNLQAHRESAGLTSDNVAGAGAVSVEEIDAIEGRQTVDVEVVRAYLGTLIIAADQSGSGHYRWRGETVQWRRGLAPSPTRPAVDRSHHDQAARWYLDRDLGR